VNFALQFQNAADVGGAAGSDDKEPPPANSEGKEQDSGDAPKDDGRGEVISLDKFRKK